MSYDFDEYHLDLIGKFHAHDYFFIAVNNCWCVKIFLYIPQLGLIFDGHRSSMISVKLPFVIKINTSKRSPEPEAGIRPRPELSISYRTSAPHRVRVKTGLTGGTSSWFCTPMVDWCRREQNNWLLCKFYAILESRPYPDWGNTTAVLSTIGVLLYQDVTNFTKCLIMFFFAK